MASEGKGFVYGLHAFIAENEDEISFGPGERVLVLEKDDQYGDGWWQVSPPAQTCFSSPPLAPLALAFPRANQGTNGDDDDQGLGREERKRRALLTD